MPSIRQSVPRCELHPEDATNSRWLQPGWRCKLFPSCHPAWYIDVSCKQKPCKIELIFAQYIAHMGDMANILCKKISLLRGMVAITTLLLAHKFWTTWPSCNFRIAATRVFKTFLWTTLLGYNFSRMRLCSVMAANLGRGISLRRQLYSEWRTTSSGLVHNIGVAGSHVWT